jgi:hypothetical protein
MSQVRTPYGTDRACTHVFEILLQLKTWCDIFVTQDSELGTPHGTCTQVVTCNLLLQLKTWCDIFVIFALHFFRPGVGQSVQFSWKFRSEDFTEEGQERFTECKV